jgi:hypothetical protein
MINLDFFLLSWYNPAEKRFHEVQDEARWVHLKEAKKTVVGASRIGGIGLGRSPLPLPIYKNEMLPTRSRFLTLFLLKRHLSKISSLAGLAYPTIMADI